jgi:hypothetical protein
MFVLQLHNSSDSLVVLQSVNLSSSGRYRCEVSGEAPSFNTVDGYGDMVVVGRFMCKFIKFSTRFPSDPELRRHKYSAHEAVFNYISYSPPAQANISQFFSHLNLKFRLYLAQPFSPEMILFFQVKRDSITKRASNNSFEEKRNRIKITIFRLQSKISAAR